MAEGICSIVSCERPVVARSWCSMHWQRWRRHGDPLVVIGHPGPRTDAAARFRSKVDNADPDGCWPWTGGVDRDGYGFFKVARRMWRAPRYAFNLAHPDGPLADDEMVRHTCDNPVCVRPGHLVRGDALANSADQVERDRTTRGDRHYTRRTPDTRLRGTANGSSVLTDDTVRSIRSAYAAGATQVALATEHGVTQSLISKIVRRTIWTHLEE